MLSPTSRPRRPACRDRSERRRPRALAARHDCSSLFNKPTVPKFMASAMSCGAGQHDLPAAGDGKTLLRGGLVRTTHLSLGSLRSRARRAPTLRARSLSLARRDLLLASRRSRSGSRASPQGARCRARRRASSRGRACSTRACRERWLPPRTSRGTTIRARACRRPTERGSRLPAVTIATRKESSPKLTSATAPSARTAERRPSASSATPRTSPFGARSSVPRGATTRAVPPSSVTISARANGASSAGTTKSTAPPSP